MIVLPVWLIFEHTRDRHGPELHHDIDLIIFALMKVQNDQNTHWFETERQTLRNGITPLFWREYGGTALFWKRWQRLFGGIQDQVR